MSEDIRVHIEHGLWLGVAALTVGAGEIKQGTVMIVRQNGSETTLYGKGFVKSLSPDMLHRVRPSPRNSIHLTHQLELLALYLWMLRQDLCDRHAVAEMARNMIEAIINANSDTRNRGFPETDKGALY
jgi:hypothetical protein